MLEEVKRNLEGQSFDSEKDLQQALEQQLSVHNQQPQSDFHGLSPDQMYRLLYQPFESPELIQFGEGVRGRPPALIAGLFEVIAEEAYDQPGIKLTDRGNLPRSVVNRAKDMLDPEELAEEEAIGVIRNEGDWEQLHVTRLVVDMAGLTRKHNGRLLLTRKARSLLDQGDWAELFRILLHTYCRRFNWAYSDGYPEMPLIQQGFGFSLYLLHRYGDQWRSPQFYADAFLQAFPDLPEEIGEEERRFLAPEEQARKAWELRTLSRFGGLFGLVDWREDPEGDRGPLGVGRSWSVRRAPFMDQVVQWGGV